MDFDDAVQIQDEYIDYKLPELGYCDGKFKKAYHFERKSKNLLPPETASVETAAEFRMVPFEAKTFYRNEDDAKLSSLRLYSKTGREIKLVWETDGIPAQTETFNLREGWNEFSVKFQPSLFLPGKRNLHFIFYDQHEKKIFEKTYLVEIKNQLRHDLVKFLSWGGFGDVPLDYLVQLGINAVNVRSIGKMDEISEMGMFINYDLRNTRELEENNFDIKKTALQKVPEIRAMKNYFNWYGTLLNSEAFHKWLVKDWDKYPLLLKQAEKELGFTPPVVNILPPYPLFADDVIPDQYGIYNTPGKAYETFQWFVNKGQMTIQLNAENARLIKDIAPENLIWTEPAISSIGMFENVDMAAAWGYWLGTTEVLAEFRKGYAYARDAKKLFQPTVAMSHWVNHALNADVNGRKCLLSLTVDELTANTWIAIGALPAHDIDFWNVFAWYDAENTKEKYIGEPGLLKSFGQLVQEQLYPAAVLLRDMPVAQPDVTLLIPASSGFYSENSSWTYNRLNLLWGRYLSQNQINYDILYEDDVTMENLKRYKVVIFPMSDKVSLRVHDALMKVADSTTIVVDRYCRRNYPNMKMIDHKFNVSDGYKSEPFKPCSDFIKQLYLNLAPSLNVRAEGEKGPVMVFERNYGLVRYIIVLNNLWTTGELNKYAVEQEIRGVKYQPYGVAQKAKVAFKSPAEPVIYDFLKSQRINSRKSGEYAELDIELLPGGAKIFCIYPHEFKEIKISQDGVSACGKTVYFTMNLYDTANSAPGGRQLIDLEIIDAAGNKTDESGLYPMENGVLRVPVRIAVNSPAGKWTLDLCERSSGLRQSFNFTVVGILH
jgi:hypothetical protein